jgi:hypothetical protein
MRYTFQIITHKETPVVINVPTLNYIENVSSIFGYSNLRTKIIP